MSLSLRTGPARGTVSLELDMEGVHGTSMFNGPGSWRIGKHPNPIRQLVKTHPKLQDSLSIKLAYKNTNIRARGYS